MIRERKRADGSIAYLVEVKHKGKRHTVGTYPSHTLATEAEQEFKVERRKIDRGELPEHVSHKRTLNDALDAWLASLRPGTRGFRSKETYSRYAKLYLRPDLGDQQLASITTETIENHRDALHLRLSVNTTNGAIAYLSIGMSYAVKRKWLDKNPCARIERLSSGRDKRSYKWLQTRPEIERLLLHCDGALRDAVALSIGTGMRQGELRNLHWDDIELERRTIHVRRGDKGPPKTGPRIIPILDSVLPVLRSMALRRGSSVLVLPGDDGRVRDSGSLGRGLRAALRRAGLDTGMRWHDLRHTMASQWVMSGGDIFRLSKVLGHHSVKVTESIYAHLAPDVWKQDYCRVAFRVPDEVAKVYEIDRNERGQIVGTSVAGLSPLPRLAASNALK